MASCESRRPRLEIACFTSTSAIRAAHFGADRIELCAARDVGGVTPSIEDLEITQAYSRTKGVPVYVMIRPRGGDFVYSEQDITEMESSIRSFSHASGFVFGALTPSNLVDVDTCTRLLALTNNRPCTFHRAFDSIPPEQMAAQLAILISLGFKSILTSGGAPNAVAGSDILCSLVKQANSGIEIIAGGGVRSANAGLIRQTGVPWLHSSAVVDESDEASEEEIGLMVRACA